MSQGSKSKCQLLENGRTILVSFAPPRARAPPALGISVVSLWHPTYSYVAVPGNTVAEEDGADDVEEVDWATMESKNAPKTMAQQRVSGKVSLIAPDDVVVNERAKNTDEKGRETENRTKRMGNH
ncbi:MAG: hypothetical protein M1837_003468 [Sclerophora amabilis]|nr:MAG: hypothetical protein M1837_003468 [Sclerophora amabilis]